MNKYLVYSLIIFLTICLGLFLNVIQYVKDVSLDLFSGSFIYLSIFILILMCNFFLYFTKPMFIFFFNSYIIVFLFLLNINNDIFRSGFSLIISSIAFCLLIGVYMLITMGDFDYKIMFCILLLGIIGLVWYITTLNDNNEKKINIMECFCKKKKILRNFTGPCMANDHAWGYMKDGACIPKNICKTKSVVHPSVSASTSTLTAAGTSISTSRISGKHALSPTITSTVPPTVDPPAVHTLLKPINDDFDFWCKYSNGLGYNAKNINPQLDKPGYATATCSKDISNNFDINDYYTNKDNNIIYNDINNYHMYVPCFNNKPNYSHDIYNQMCSNKLPNTNYDQNSIGAYNCPIGQIRFKCIAPLSII